jgi:serine/threonine protein kinase
VIDALIGGFKGLRHRARPAATAHGDAALDASLADFRSLRFRRDASNAEAGRARRFELDPRRETRTIGAGAMLKDRFILDAEIGRGGMGTVYRAVDRRRLEAMHRQPYVAIKLLNGDFRHHPKALRTIEAEARRAQELAHPNIVTIHDFERDGGHLFVVMELLAGEPLDALLQRGRPEPALAAAILAGLCAGLGHAHARGVVHADVKPANVFLVDDGTVKLLDFGIASAARDGGFDTSSLGGMTLPYASPQMTMLDERRPDDDVYALGCIAYELYVGPHPFSSLPALDAREKCLLPVRPAGIEDRLWATIAAALSFERSARPRDAIAFHRGMTGG